MSARLQGMHARPHPNKEPGASASPEVSRGGGAAVASAAAARARRAASAASAASATASGNITSKET